MFKVVFWILSFYTVFAYSATNLESKDAFSVTKYENLPLEVHGMIASSYELWHLFAECNSYYLKMNAFVDEMVIKPSQYGLPIPRFLNRVYAIDDGFSQPDKDKVIRILEKVLSEAIQVKSLHIRNVPIDKQLEDLLSEQQSLESFTYEHPDDSPSPPLSGIQFLSDFVNLKHLKLDDLTKDINKDLFFQTIERLKTNLVSLSISSAWVGCELPETIFKDMNALESLVLDINLNAIPDFSSLAKLKHLSYMSTRLNINPSTFRGLDKLRQLIIFANDVAIESGSCQHMKELRYFKINFSSRKKNQQNIQGLVQEMASIGLAYNKGLGAFTKLKKASNA